MYKDRYNICRTIVSFDKDKERYDTLVKMVKKSGATCIKAQCHDFLKVPLIKLYSETCTVINIKLKPSYSS